MTHTPGPWRVEATTNPMEARKKHIGLSFAISSGSSGHTKAIGSVADSVVGSDYIDANDNHLCMGDEYTSAEDIANARLIASAPDLLEALKALLESIENVNFGVHDDDGQTYDAIPWAQAEAAIAKAEEEGSHVGNAYQYGG